MNENNENQIVTPINEVKVEEKTINQEEITPQEPKLSPKQEELIPEPNSGKKSNIFLIILFIFFFVLIMGMPEINDYIDKIKQEREQANQNNQIVEETKPTPTPTATNTIKELNELTCTLTNTSNPSYTLIIVQTFSYNSNNQIINSKLDYKYTFSTIDETYNNLKNSCSENALKYATHNGYTTACSYGDTNIEISHEFELETFTPIVDDTTNIQANATYKQELNTIKTTLISQGYTCDK